MKAEKKAIARDVKAGGKGIAGPPQDRMMTVEKTRAHGPSFEDNGAVERFVQENPKTVRRALRRHLGLMVALCLALGARAATVTGSLQDLRLGAVDMPLTFYPTNAVLVSGPALSIGPPLTVYTTNGNFSTVIEAGHYVVAAQTQTWRKPFTIDVPAGTNSYSVTNLISPRLLIDGGGGALLADP